MKEKIDKLKIPTFRQMTKYLKQLDLTAASKFVTSAIQKDKGG